MANRVMSNQARGKMVSGGAEGGRRLGKAERSWIEVE